MTAASTVMYTAAELVEKRPMNRADADDFHQLKSMLDSTDLSYHYRIDYIAHGGIQKPQDGDQAKQKRRVVSHILK